MEGVGRRLVQVRWLAMLLLLASFGVGARSEVLGDSVQVRGVPFQAVQVVTRVKEGRTTVTRGLVARDAAGSTYVEMVDAQTGVATTAFLLDVPGRRGIVLDLVRKRYSVRPAPQLAARELVAAEIPGQLARAVAARGRTEGDARDGSKTTVEHLGTKLVSGLMAIGRREVLAGGRAEDGRREMESWFSVDLGMCVRMVETERARNERTEVELTEVLRVDPNGAFFRIPEGFVPDDAAQTGDAGPAADGE